MIICLNGSLGVGKTSVANYLLWCSPKTVLLEGDALCNINPFDPYDQDRIRTLSEIFRFMVAQYRKIGYTRFVIDSIFEKQDEVASLHHRLGQDEGEIFHYLLHCRDDARNARIDARKRENYLWEKQRSAELQELLLAEFQTSGLVKTLDSSDRSPSEVGDWILNDIAAQRKLVV